MLAKFDNRLPFVGRKRAAYEVKSILIGAALVMAHFSQRKTWNAVPRLQVSDRNSPADPKGLTFCKSSL